jgi:hypothetical protein
VRAAAVLVVGLVLYVALHTRMCPLLAADLCSGNKGDASKTERALHAQRTPMDDVLL